MNKYLSIVACLLLIVSADQDLGSVIGNLGLDKLGLESLPAVLPESYSLPSMSEGQELWKEKCLKNGNNGSYEILTGAREGLKLCFSDIVDIENIQKEIEEAKPKGELDEVFKKYCRKVPELKKCISNYTMAFEDCMDEKEKETKRMAQNISDSLFNFICFKEGDRIALFIAEGGPVCIESKVDAIQNCVNSSFHKYIPEQGESINASSSYQSIPSVDLNEEQCMDIESLQACVVAELEHCDEPTPANIVESLFNYIKKSTPCSTLLKASSAPNLTSFSLLFFIPLLLSSIGNYIIN